MKKIVFYLMFPVLLFSQSFLISNIPLPKTYIQNIDPYGCDNRCLRKYLEEDMIFSFLAHTDSKIDDEELEDARMINIVILNVGSNVIVKTIKLAILLPYKKIGKYASSTTNVVFSYLMTKSNSFEFKSYKIDDETFETIKTTLDDIKNDGFEYVIAPLTKDGVKNVALLNPNINIFFPTVNKKDINTTSSYLYFGGIDYKKQSDILLKQAQKTLVIFSDNSKISTELANYQTQKFLEEDNTTESNETNEFSIVEEDVLDENVTQKRVINFKIAKRTTNLEKYLKDNEDIIEASFFVDTPIVKTGMIMSQLTLFETNATNVLSTQINYDPLILSMTQYKDRKDMLIANSITEVNNVLSETNSILGNDIVYDWINYTTIIGVDYFFNLMTNIQREYEVEVKENQFEYKIDIVKPSYYRFLKQKI